MLQPTLPNRLLWVCKLLPWLFIMSVLSWVCVTPGISAKLYQTASLCLMSTWVPGIDKQLNPLVRPQHTFLLFILMLIISNESDENTIWACRSFLLDGSNCQYLMFQTAVFIIILIIFVVIIKLLLHCVFVLLWRCSSSMAAHIGE